LGFADLGALLERADGAGEGAEGDPVELAAQGGPGLSGGGLGDPGKERGEPAEQDVSVDALLLAVEHRPQVDDLLHVPPAALDLEQLLVAERDVLGGHLRVGCAQQVLAVQVLLGLGVEADDEPFVLADPDLFDLQVVADLLVAALAGECVRRTPTASTWPTSASPPLESPPVRIIDMLTEADPSR
jgi:hypothetical protein